MVLAGVLLKLGSFGLLLFLPYLKANHVLHFYLGMSLIGSIVSSIICLRQGDLKLLIAYSSVVHMSVVTLGFIRGTEAGYTCGVMMVFRHGLSSPILFAFSFLLYESSHSRLLLNNTMAWPLLISGLFTLVRLNMSVPPRLGIWSEVLMTMTVIAYANWAFAFLLLILFLGVVYNLYIYSSCMHSKYSRFSKVTDTMIYPIIQSAFYGYSSFFCLDLFHI